MVTLMPSPPSSPYTYTRVHTHLSSGGDGCLISPTLVPPEETMWFVRGWLKKQNKKKDGVTWKVDCPPLSTPLWGHYLLERPGCHQRMTAVTLKCTRSRMVKFPFWRGWDLLPTARFYPSGPLRWDFRFGLSDGWKLNTRRYSEISEVWGVKEIRFSLKH